MREPGRISAAIEIVEDFDARRVPLKTVIADWSRNNRYAGSKDRAWISGLCLDVLRRRHSLGAAMGDDSPRSAVLAAMRFMWGASVEELVECAAAEHGPGALNESERARLETQSLNPEWAACASPPCEAGEIDPVYAGQTPSVGDYPEWLASHVERAFGANSSRVMNAFCERADIDLRVNSLKSTPDKALAAMKIINAEAAPILINAARIAAPAPSEKAPGVTIIPAFNKGWVEVQDLGSQIAAAAAGKIKGAQVLDYCAGGGGKSLALAAMMENTGQLYAYDRDARRLAPLYDRAKRAGVRNLQIRSPAGGENLDDLAGKMDVVFVDAPCTGAGTWRRHPDTKWRLTEKQLQTRMEEQDAVLIEASRFVKPGGRLVWVTCSFLMEENEDRLASYLADNKEFSLILALDAINASGQVTQAGNEALQSCVTSDGAIRLTPDKIRADGFFVAVLVKSGSNELA
ncbi:RsmB/NOP family class I SAM-dependent RNA methyltransferase [Hyphococcus sp.]|uniref:RsmB/NOP family class I SAM-dependent RNA methyltransferase n=1 Tax=Hyphococcus sp. TaxID=2038636 RepID=UPI00208752C7|nr:MAG: tRNA/rRNA methyltransferase [Marinicaulis sp.]